MAKTKEIKKMGELSAKHFISNFEDATINQAKTSIRIQTGFSQMGRNINISWDYFTLNQDGVIIQCPRGYTKEYKGYKVTDLDLFKPTILFSREV